MPVLLMLAALLFSCGEYETVEIPDRVYLQATAGPSVEPDGGTTAVVITVTIR